MNVLPTPNLLFLLLASAFGRLPSRYGPRARAASRHDPARVDAAAAKSARRQARNLRNAARGAFGRVGFLV